MTICSRWITWAFTMPSFLAIAGLSCAETRYATGQDVALVWTLTSAGRTNKAFGTLMPVWEIGNMVYQENRGGPGDLSYPGEPNQAPSIEMVGSSQRTVAVGEALS